MEISAKINSYRHFKQKEEKDFFKDIELNISTNGLYFLIGSSGIGKTTLLNILLGLNDGYFDGNVNYKFNGTTNNPLGARKNNHLGYQSQDFSLIPWLSIKDNVLLPLKLNKNIRNFDETDVATTFTSLNLDYEDIKNKYRHQLSFGMRARVGLARTILSAPNLFVLDELFTGTDTYTNKQIKLTLETMKNDKVIFAVSHHLDMAFDCADAIFLLHNHNNSKKISYYSKSVFFNNKSKQEEITNLLN